MRKKKPDYMAKVNLDALIPREDFIFSGEQTKKSKPFDKITLGHMLPNRDKNYQSIHHLLKKPDFQRETKEWDKARIATLIESFIDGSFIPSIILWKNQQTGNIYVIDGAHRLSAIIAYINDDYGDKDISHEFYGYNRIPQAELEIAEVTRKYVNKRLGAFEDVMAANGDKADGLKQNEFDVQWIDGDVKKAEDSFFKINQKGVVLTPIERELCKSRHMPTCIATRAIIKGGAGTQYWKNFSADNQTRVKNIAQELNNLLFIPPYKEDTISVIRDHPLGGNITTATAMIFELMKIIKSTKRNGDESEDLISGDETLFYMVKARDIIWKMLSMTDGSLGLFPSIYFYNGLGTFIESSFLGMAHLILENENDKHFFLTFTEQRAKVESFLIDHKVFLTQLNRTYGSKGRSHRHIKGFFMNLIAFMKDGHAGKKLLDKLKEKENVLNENESEIGRLKGDRFTKQLKKNEKIKGEIKSSRKCYICGSYIHPSSISHDHRLDRKLGGKNEPSNHEITHVYCNNSKDKLIERGVLKIELTQ